MTQKDKMLHMVLKNERLMSSYHYTASDFEDLDVYEAFSSDNAIIAAVARIVKELNGATDESSQKLVHKKVFNHLNTKLLV